MRFRRLEQFEKWPRNLIPGQRRFHRYEEYRVGMTTVLLGDYVAAPREPDIPWIDH
jgi:hypothetical protein